MCLSCKAWHYFLREVYSKFPPRSYNQVQVDAKLEALNSIEAMSKKILKVLRECSFDYHPDKNSKATFGEEWGTISEEVTKYANQLHDEYKKKINLISGLD